MWKNVRTLIGAWSLVLGAGVAYAQEPQENEPQEECPPGQAPVVEPPAPVYQPPPVTMPAPAPRHEVHVRARPAWSPDNMSLTAGGGVGNFVRDRISDLNGAVAGTWDVRYLYGTRTWLGFEGSYQGTAAGGSDTLNTGTVTTQQFSGALRFNLTRMRIQPFLTAGAGWANLHRNLNQDIGNVSVGVSDNSFMVPFAGGIAGYIGRHGVVDVRGNYNLITSKDFTNTGARPDMWTAELRAGYAF